MKNVREPTDGELIEYAAALERLCDTHLGVVLPENEVLVERIRGPIRAERVLLNGRPILTITWDPWTASCVYTLTPHGARLAERETGRRPERRHLVEGDPFGLMDFEPTGTKRDLDEALDCFCDEYDVEILEYDRATRIVRNVEVTAVAFVTARGFLYLDVVPPDPAGRSNPVNLLARLIHAFGREETEPWPHPSYRFLGVRGDEDEKVVTCEVCGERVSFKAVAGDELTVEPIGRGE